MRLFVWSVGAVCWALVCVWILKNLQTPLFFGVTSISFVVMNAVDDSYFCSGWYARRALHLGNILWLIWNKWMFMNNWYKLLIDRTNSSHVIIIMLLYHSCIRHSVRYTVRHSPFSASISSNFSMCFLHDLVQYRQSNDSSTSCKQYKPQCPKLLLSFLYFWVFALVWKTRRLAK